MRVSLLSVIYLFGLLEQQYVGDKYVNPQVINIINKMLLYDCLIQGCQK